MYYCSKQIKRKESRMNTEAITGRRFFKRAGALVALIAIVTAASIRLQADTGSCGGVTTTLPFNDVMGNPFFCQIAEAFFSGLSNGTSATTYSPSQNVPREQMAAFVTRTLDQSVKRSSKRAALNQNWTTQVANNLALTTVGPSPQFVQSDGADLWVANSNSSVSRVRASDGKLLETWSNASGAIGVLCAMGKVFITGDPSGGQGPGNLYQIDPAQPPGAVTTVATIGAGPVGIAYDGQRIWTANSFEASVSIITLNPTSVVNAFIGFTFPFGIIYDGANIWVTDDLPGKLHKLDSNGVILLSVNVGSNPHTPAFDGTNIWVPNTNSNTVSVVRRNSTATTPLATLSGNGLNAPTSAAFDGERIIVTNFNGNSVSLWKATDLTPIGTFSTGANTNPFVACSDGLNFWITLNGSGKLARF